MIDGRFIVELWEFFKAHSDKKQIDVMAEKYVDILADYGVEDDAFKEALGSDEDLDTAINYYLDLDEQDEDYSFMSGWYQKIARDIGQIPNAVAHYEQELDQAKYEVKIKGNLEKNSAAMPGIVEQRFNQLQEIEAILQYLNIELRRLRSKHFKKYLENYQRALSSRDVEKYVDGESDVVDYEKIINEFALLRNKWLGITKALDQKQWQITNITKLRVAGMEDATI